MNRVYLLDTCIVSEPAKPVPVPSVLDKLSKAEGRCCIAAFVWHELLYGIARLGESERKRRLSAYAFDVVAPNLPVTAYDSRAAQIHATLRAASESSGKPLPFIDGAIASIALANNLILVTRNVADYEGIPDLSVENWFEEGS